MTSSPGIQRKLADLTRNRRVRVNEVPITLAEKRWHLKETEVFAPLSETDQTWLMENTTLTCERGRVFYEPDETGEVIFILKRGKVDLYRLTADGRKLTVHSSQTPPARSHHKEISSAAHMQPPRRATSNASRSIGEARRTHGRRTPKSLPGVIM